MNVKGEHETVNQCITDGWIEVDREALLKPTDNLQ